MGVQAKRPIRLNKRHHRCETHAATAAAAPSTSQWPDGLRRFVERCFTAASTPDLRAAAQAELKVIINEANASNTLWTKEWDRAPMPACLGGTRPHQFTPAPPPGRPPPTAMAVDHDRRSRGSGPATSYVSDESGARMRQSQWDEGQSARAAAARQRWEDMQEQARSRKEERQRAKAEKAAAKQKQKKQRTKEKDKERAPSSAELARRSERAGRFGAGNADGTIAKGPVSASALNVTTYSGGAIAKEDLYDAEPIVGTSEALEKSFFRLTSAPDPATVRPAHVLRKALDRAQALWRGGSVTYFYLQDQMKGMRQDLTVQHIMTPLSVEVYETHCRMALEYGDVVDLNQCLAKLKHLYHVVDEDPSPVACQSMTSERPDRTRPVSNSCDSRGKGRPRQKGEKQSQRTQYKVVKKTTSKTKIKLNNYDKRIFNSNKKNSTPIKLNI